MARVSGGVNPAALRAVADESPELNLMLANSAREMIIKARAVFLARQRADNEWRTSETTPPKYASSFSIERVQHGITYTWMAINDDPAAHWVEWGAHAGGRTPVLRYNPLRIALFAQGVTN